MSLVYSKQRHGGPVFHGIRVPGWLDPLPPARMPHNLYYPNRAIFKVAPYDKQSLESIFGGEFPNIKFTLRQIKYLNHSQLVVLCQALRITSSKLQSTDNRREAVYRFLKENG
jgi:hypothetical protein